MNKKVLAVFQNRTQTLTFSRNLNKYGVKTKIVNTPREISTSCGLSVMFEHKDLQKAKVALNGILIPSFLGFYLVSTMGGFVRYVKI